MRHNVLLGTSLAALLAFTTGGAKADLLNRGYVDLTGTGLGNVPTILTMQAKNNNSESGKVSWGLLPGGGYGDIVTADPGPYPTTNTKMVGPGVQNETITMADALWTSGQGLGIVFNPSEPGSAANITLNALIMTIYDDKGNVVFNAPWVDSGAGDGPPQSFVGKGGTGLSGYLFSLNDQETIDLNKSGVTLGDHIGLTAYATNASGDAETFFGTVIACKTSACGDPVPEPMSLALLGVSLLGLGSVKYGSKLIS